MLLILIGYAATAGAIFAFLMQPCVVIETRAAKLRWIALCTVCGLLWPVALLVLAGLRMWAGRPD
jgi:hypothetical protein